MEASVYQSSRDRASAKRRLKTRRLKTRRPKTGESKIRRAQKSPAVVDRAFSATRVSPRGGFVDADYQ